MLAFAENPPFWSRQDLFLAGLEGRTLVNINAMIDKKLLSMLVCPASKAPLIFVEDKDELVCLASGLAYPIRDGIPVMLESEAREISLEEKESYAGRVS